MSFCVLQSRQLSERYDSQQAFEQLERPCCGLLRVEPFLQPLLQSCMRWTSQIVEVRPGFELLEMVQTLVEWVECMWWTQAFGWKVDNQTGGQRVDF